MTSKLLTDAEAHELIMARQASLPREEWQARIDEANAVFNRQEAAERAYAGSASHVKRNATPKRSHKVTEVLTG
jgi:hypothetical protein